MGHTVAPSSRLAQKDHPMTEFPDKEAEAHFVGLRQEIAEGFRTTAEQVRYLQRAMLRCADKLEEYGNDEPLAVAQYLRRAAR
jgi:hypothetical protein